MIIPGILISLVTFPGVVVHELGHQFFCRLLGVPVYEVCYYRFGNPCGYVQHEPPVRPGSSFWISVGPFLVNTVVGSLILLPASVELFQFDHYGNPINLVLGWLGLSILMHAFPSTGDAQCMVDGILKNARVGLWVKILTAPVIGLIYLGAFGSVVWLDLLYGVGLGLLLPNLLVGLWM